MLSSLLSSTMFMLSTGSALVVTILIFYLIMNEVIEVKLGKEEIRKAFFPVILSLFVVFLASVINKMLEILI
jgi:hypothetical protein